MSPAMKGDAPAFVICPEGEAAAEYAADAGDPAGQQHQQCDRKADQRTADRRGNRSKIGHDSTSRCCRCNKHALTIAVDDCRRESRLATRFS